MKRHLSKLVGVKLVDERGIYIPFLAIALVSLIAVFGLALDAGKGYWRRLQAQRVADATAIAGAGMLSVDPLKVSSLGGTFNFCREVGRVGLHNLYARNLLSTTEDTPSNVTFTQITNASGVVGAEANVDGVVLLTVTLVGKTVGVTVGFPSRIDLIRAAFPDSISENLQIGAMAEATVSPAIVMMLLDTSASMDNPDKIVQMQAASLEFIEYFDDVTDHIGIIAFGTEAEVLTPLASGNRTQLVAALNSLSTPGNGAGGATNVSHALQLAYQQLHAVHQSSTTTGVGFYDQSRVSIVLMSDGSPTAATLDFKNPKLALPENPPGSGHHRYLSFGVDRNAAGEMLVPVRLLPSSATPDRHRASDPDAEIVPCSVKDATGYYSPTDSYAGCVDSLAFRITSVSPANIEYPSIAYLESPTVSFNNFETVYHLAAIAEADRLRKEPKRNGEDGNAKFYTVGFGPDVAPTCRTATSSVDNAMGGLCAQDLKESFLRRIALDDGVRNAILNSAPLANYSGYPELNSNVEEHFVEGSYNRAVSGSALLQELRWIAKDIRLSLVS